MVGVLSDVGNVRRINEDFLDFFEDEDKRVYVIADGMGGHNAGEIASRLAVEKTIEFIKGAADFNDTAEVLRKGILYSNSEILKLSRENETMNGMGTTITACIIKDGKIYIANLGDSCGFIIKNDEIIKITKDHSLVQELIDEGSITETEARNHPNKNIITRALGTSSKVEVDIYEIPIGDVKKIILCTDGLSNEVDPREMLKYITNSKTNTDACEELINLAKSRGGRDNISVMIFEGECRDDWYYTE